MKPLFLMLVFLRVNLHHAFVPNTHSERSTSSCSTSTRRKVPSSMMTTSTFSTTIENDNGIEMIEEEPTAEPEDILRLDYSNAMTEITRRILSTEIDGDEDSFNDTDTNTDNDGPINLVDEEELYWKSAKITTNTIISVLNYHYKETVEGAEMIQKILSRLEERCDSSSKGSGSSDTYDNINDKKFAYRLHCGHYTIALNAWSKSGHPASAQRATEMVHRMKERNIELNAVTYNSWMNAYVIQNNISKVEEILQIMEEHMIDEMRVKDYNVLILANARQGRAMEAEQIVKRMVDMYSEGKSTILPDLISYSMLLDAWSKSDEVGRGERAETILDSIEERQISFDTSAYENPESTISATYVAAMRAVIRSGEDNIVERVEKIRQRAAERGVVPDSYVYATLLDAYATTHPSDASVRVEEILKLMEDNIDTVDSVGQTVVYNTALKLLRESPGQDAITKAEELFQKMKSQGNVDEVTYGTMIALYTSNDRETSHASVTRIEELMKEMTESNLETNTHHMNSVMNSLIRVGRLSRATALLDKMEEHYRNGNYCMKPNVVSYSTLMNGWAKSTDPQKSIQTMIIFDRLKSMFLSGNQDAQPNFVSYVTLVDSIVKSGEENAAERAENIVRSMYEEYKSGKIPVKPNAQLVATVIDCWSKSGDNNAGERAEALLDWSIDIYQEDKDPKLRPIAFPFSSAITAWAKSRKFGKATRAKAILEKMKSLHKAGIIKSPPNIYCYTAVFNACAYTERDSLEKRDALKVFVDVYKEMINEDDVIPNHVTFVTVLTALRNLLAPDERRASAVGTVFEKCKEMGMCDFSVIKRLQSVVNPAQLKELVGDERVKENGDIDISLIPALWSCNVESIPKKRNRNIPRKGPAFQKKRR